MNKCRIMFITKITEQNPIGKEWGPLCGCFNQTEIHSTGHDLSVRLDTDNALSLTAYTMKFSRNKGTYLFIIHINVDCMWNILLSFNSCLCFPSVIPEQLFGVFK